MDFTTIQIKRDTAAAWSSYNPVLAQGEIGEVLSGSPLRMTAQKVGDGITAWNDLPYTMAPPATGGYLVGRDYTTIAAAVAAIGSTKATLMYGTDQTVAANLTVPATLELMPLNGAVITVNSGITLTIKSSTARWPICKMFAGTGTVTGLVNADVAWFGAVADCVLDGTLHKVSGTDNYAAFRAAIDSLGRNDPYSPAIEMYAATGHLHIGKGTYYISATLELKHPVVIEGDGSGQQTDEASYLWFPPDVTGYIVHRHNTLGTSTVASTTGADASVLRGLSIASYKGADVTKHGIYLRARATIEDCFIQGFTGNGINVVASAGGGGSAEGNANNFAINRVVTYGNGQNGLYLTGADANAGTIVALDSEYNGQWGVCDHSFLGNTYVACHVVGNTVGSYLMDSATAGGVMVGCYSESGWPASKIMSPSMSVGGLHGAGFTADSTGAVLNGSNSGLVVAPSLVADSGANARVTIGGGTDTPMAFTDNAENSGSFPFRLHRGSGGFYLDWANNGNKLLMLYNTRATVANGFARTVAAGAMGLGEYYFGPNMTLHTYAAAMPASGTWKTGDVVWNTAPSVANPVGYWLRVTDGSGNVLDTDWVAK